MKFELPSALVAVAVFGYAAWILYRRGLGRPLPAPWSESLLIRYAVATGILSGLAVGFGMADMGGPLPLNRLFWRFDSLGPDRWHLWHLIRDGYGPIEEHVLAFCSMALLPLLAALLLARAIARSSPQPTTEQTRAVRLCWIDGVTWTAGLILLIPAGFSPQGAFVIAGLVALCILAGPAFRWLLAAIDRVTGAQTPGDSSSPDRQRVLRLLEDGKINGSECAALLAAITQNCDSDNKPLTAGRKQMLLGALVVLIAFFLPWFSVNPWAEASRIIPSSIPFGPEFGNITMQTPQITGTSASRLSIHAGDIARGLGWWVLVLSLTAASLPYLVGSMPRQTQRSVTFVGILGTSIIELYLLSQGIGSAVWGIWFALAGTAMLWLGSYREYLMGESRPGTQRRSRST